MTKKIIIDETTRENLNRKLYAFGLSIEGASKAPSERWWVTIKKGCSATYDEMRVAKLIMQELKVREIVLDGKMFESVA